eukprot:GEMP01008026.1.p1 GENE.GEMP01008026.1~~GEMP01008026.1.p1  ORF type:complete len:494 (+),score=120.53 GEMP01008026.1:320-1801(+)
MTDDDRAAQLQEPLVKADATVSADRMALSAQRRLRWAVGFVAVFMVAEIIGGIWANSLAIITDAAHMMSDMGGFLVSMFSLALVSKKATEEYSFGYHQAEVIGALISVLMVWLLTGMLLIEAVGRFRRPQEINGAMMFGLACLGLVVNLILMKTLGHGHSHAGGGGHEHAHDGGHDHAHGGGHDHAHGNEKTTGHGHTHGADKKGDHSHGDSDHGHSHDRRKKDDHAHGDGSHSHSSIKKDDHSHGDGGHGHSHGNISKKDDHSHGDGGQSHCHGNSSYDDNTKEIGDRGRCTQDDLENPSEDTSQYLDNDSEEEQESLAMQAALAHVIGDVVQSAGVILASIFIWTHPFDIGVTKDGVSKWNYADPVCTALFAVLVILTTKSTIVGIMRSLMLCAPERVSSESVLQKLLQIPHVVGCHDIHIWEVGRNPVFTAHVLVDKQENSTAALYACIACMKDNFKIDHSTIQIEIQGEFDHAVESYGLLHDHSTCCDK